MFPNTFKTLSEMIFILAGHYRIASMLSGIAMYIERTEDLPDSILARLKPRPVVTVCFFIYYYKVANIA